MRVMLIGGLRSGEWLDVPEDYPHYSISINLPVAVDDVLVTNQVAVSFLVENYDLKRVGLFSRMIVVGSNKGTDEDLARELLKPEVFELWKNSR